jgi:hypothetical protein
VNEDTNDPPSPRGRGKARPDLSTSAGIAKFVAGAVKRYEDGDITSDMYHALLSAARIAASALDVATRTKPYTIEDEPSTAPIAKECTKSAPDASCADCVAYDPDTNSCASIDIEGGDPEC